MDQRSPLTPTTARFQTLHMHMSRIELTTSPTRSGNSRRARSSPLNPGRFSTAWPIQSRTGWPPMRGKLGTTAARGAVGGSEAAAVAGRRGRLVVGRAGGRPGWLVALPCTWHTAHWMQCRRFEAAEAVLQSARQQERWRRRRRQRGEKASDGWQAAITPATHSRLDAGRTGANTEGTGRQLEPWPKRRSLQASAALHCMFIESAVQQ